MYSVDVSVKSSKNIDFLNKFNNSFPEYPLVICAPKEICLCNPTLPPSGVSTGSIIPHCDECNNLGPTILALESSGKFNLRKCDKKELNDKRFKS